MDLSPPQPPLLPPPPGFHHPNNTSFPVIAIAIIGILATAFLLISYYIFVIKCCLTWHRVDIFNRFFSRVRDPSDELDSSPINPLAHDSNAEKGLDEALIRSIPVIEFRKLEKERQFNNNVNTTTARDHRAVVEEEEENKHVESSYECAVCLSEFEEGERLRVIPYCCHAFHIDCIDVWLQSNANCPLCRSGISPASILYNTQQHLVSFPPSTTNALSHHNKDETNANENDAVNESDYDDNDNDDDDDDDYVVIEIKGNNLDEPRLVRRDSSEERKNKGRKKLLKHVYIMGDELIDMRNKDEDDEFHNVQPIRRSISMDLSTQRDFCIEIQQCCRNNINNDNIIMQESEQSCSSSSSNNNSKVRRSIFSFGYGRSSRCSVQPVHLDP